MDEETVRGDRVDARWSAVFTFLTVLVVGITAFAVVSTVVGVVRYWISEVPATPPSPVSILAPLVIGGVIARFLSLRTTWGVRLQSAVHDSPAAAAERARRLRVDRARAARGARARRD